MLRKFNFDYDFKNDSLFLYDPKSKSSSSIEMDDLIVDFNVKWNVSGIELLNASKFLSTFDFKGINKNTLKDIHYSKIDFVKKSCFIMVKIFLQFNSKKTLTI